jgi:hypothetical protein
MDTIDKRLLVIHDIARYIHTVYCNELESLSAKYVLIGRVFKQINELEHCDKL